MSETETSIEPAMPSEAWAHHYSVGFPRIDVRVEGAHETRLELHGPPHGLRDHANTPENWAKVVYVMATLNDNLPDFDPHKLTRADVEALHAMLRAWDSRYLRIEDPRGLETRLASLAARIDALLPPE